jgi:hypothetical protein
MRALLAAVDAGERDALDLPPCTDEFVAKLYRAGQALLTTPAGQLLAFLDGWMPDWAGWRPDTVSAEALVFLVLSCRHPQAPRLAPECAQRLLAWADAHDSVTATELLVFYRDAAVHTRNSLVHGPILDKYKKHRAGRAALNVRAVRRPPK